MAPTLSVEGLVRDVLRREPDPPRSVTYAEVLARVLRSTLGFAAGLTVAIMLVAGAGFLWGSHGQVVPAIIAAWFLGVGCLVGLIPFTYTARVRKALVSGVRADAKVLRVDEAGGPNRRTMDAMTNGFAAGVRRVHHPLGDFDDHFRFDGKGASAIHVGSDMSVLVDPAGPRVLLDVSVSAHVRRQATPMSP